MTLREWCDRNGIQLASVAGGTNVLANERLGPAFYELFHLDDFLVCTRSGPVVWMVPRPQKGVPSA